MPFGGSALALFFYEFVFVKSQEYLNADEDDDDNNSLQDGIDASPKAGSGKKLIHGEEINEEED